jgi:hypothetical protein
MKVGEQADARLALSRGTHRLSKVKAIGVRRPSNMIA